MTFRPTLAFAALSLVAAAASAAPAPKAAPAKQACVAPTPGKTVPFALGEKLTFEIDSIGAVVGSFTLGVAPGRGKDAYLVNLHGKTGTFAGNFFAVDASVESHLTRALEGKRYTEDSNEAGVQRTTDVEFPPATLGRLQVQSTKQGNRDDYTVNAPSDTRDMLSAIYAVRSLALTPGQELCLPIFGARRVWEVRVNVVGREPVRTPAGEFKTLHLSGTARRIDNAGAPAREVHFWLTDDEAHTPVAAFGLIQNKPVRAQLTALDPGRKIAKAGK